MCTSFFEYIDTTTERKLELHLRCVVATLRLLYAHGIQRGTGAIDSALHDQLNHQCAKWQKYYDSHRMNEGLKNYNTEFLIVLIQNMINDIPSNKTISVKLATRLEAAAVCAGQAVVTRISIC